MIAARVLLGFGCDLEVVSPAGVRADQAAVAAAVVARYAAEPTDSNMRLDVG